MSTNNNNNRAQRYRNLPEVEDNNNNQRNYLDPNHEEMSNDEVVNHNHHFHQNNNNLPHAIVNVPPPPPSQPAESSSTTSFSPTNNNNNRMVPRNNNNNNNIVGILTHNNNVVDEEDEEEEEDTDSDIVILSQHHQHQNNSNNNNINNNPNRNNNNNNERKKRKRKRMKKISRERSGGGGAAGFSENSSGTGRDSPPLITSSSNNIINNNNNTNNTNDIHSNHSSGSIELANKLQRIDDYEKQENINDVDHQNKILLQQQKPRKKATFDDLPVDLLFVIIFRFLPGYHHLSFRLVAKRYNQIIQNNCCLWLRYVHRYFAYTPVLATGCLLQVYSSPMKLYKYFAEYPAPYDDMNLKTRIIYRTLEQQRRIIRKRQKVVQRKLIVRQHRRFLQIQKQREQRRQILLNQQQEQQQQQQNNNDDDDDAQQQQQQQNHNVIDTTIITPPELVLNPMNNQNNNNNDNNDEPLPITRSPPPTETIRERGEPQQEQNNINNNNFHEEVEQTTTAAAAADNNNTNNNHDQTTLLQNLERNVNSCGRFFSRLNFSRFHQNHHFRRVGESSAAFEARELRMVEDQLYEFERFLSDDDDDDNDDGMLQESNNKNNMHSSLLSTAFGGEIDWLFFTGEGGSTVENNNNNNNRHQFYLHRHNRYYFKLNFSQLSDEDISSIVRILAEAEKRLETRMHLDSEDENDELMNGMNNPDYLNGDPPQFLYERRMPEDSSLAPIHQALLLGRPHEHNISRTVSAPPILCFNGCAHRALWTMQKQRLARDVDRFHRQKWKFVGGLISLYALFPPESSFWLSLACFFAPMSIGVTILMMREDFQEYHFSNHIGQIFSGFWFFLPCVLFVYYNMRPPSFYFRDHVNDNIIAPPASTSAIANNNNNGNSPSSPNSPTSPNQNNNGDINFINNNNPTNQSVDDRENNNQNQNQIEDDFRDSIIGQDNNPNNASTGRDMMVMMMMRGVPPSESNHDSSQPISIPESTPTTNNNINISEAIAATFNMIRQAFIIMFIISSQVLFYFFVFTQRPTDSMLVFQLDSVTAGVSSRNIEPDIAVRIGKLLLNATSFRMDQDVTDFRHLSRSASTTSAATASSSTSATTSSPFISYEAFHQENNNNTSSILRGFYSSPTIDWGRNLHQWGKIPAFLAILPFVFSILLIAYDLIVAVAKRIPKIQAVTNAVEECDEACCPLPNPRRITAEEKKVLDLSLDTEKLFKDVCNGREPISALDRPSEALQQMQKEQLDDTTPPERTLNRSIYNMNGIYVTLCLPILATVFLALGFAFYGLEADGVAPWMTSHAIQTLRFGNVSIGPDPIEESTDYVAYTKLEHAFEVKRLPGANSTPVDVVAKVFGMNFEVPPFVVSTPNNATVTATAAATNSSSSSLHQQSYDLTANSRVATLTCSYQKGNRLSMIAFAFSALIAGICVAIAFACSWRKLGSRVSNYSVPMAMQVVCCLFLFLLALYCSGSVWHDDLDFEGKSGFSSPSSEIFDFNSTTVTTTTTTTTTSNYFSEQQQQKVEDSFKRYSAAFDSEPGKFFVFSTDVSGGLLYDFVSSFIFDDGGLTQKTPPPATTTVRSITSTTIVSSPSSSSTTSASASASPASPSTTSSPASANSYRWVGTASSRPMIVVGCPHRFSIPSKLSYAVLFAFLLIAMTLILNLRTCNNRFYIAKLLKYSLYFDDLYRGLVAPNYRRWTVPQPPSGSLNDPKNESHKRN